MLHDLIKNVRISREEVIYHDRNQRLSRVRALFQGFTKEYVVAEYGPRVAVLIVKGESVMLVQQYRLIKENLSWEIPGGGVDAGESLEEAARRECLEECGIRCGKINRLIEYHPGLDNIHNPTTVFYTREILEIREPQLKPEEVVGVAWVPLAQCLEMIQRGEIADALTLIALLSYDKFEHGKEGA